MRCVLDFFPPLWTLQFEKEPITKITDNLEDNHHQKEKKKQKLSTETCYKNTDQPLTSKETLCKCPEKEGRKRQAILAKQENNYLDHLFTRIGAQDVIEKISFPSRSAL